MEESKDAGNSCLAPTRQDGTPDISLKQTNNNKKNQQSETDDTSIRLVIQRFRKASLRLDECTMVTVGDVCEENSFVGMLVYASFAKSATREKVIQSAKIIMNLPVLTRGMWGDSSEPVSVLELASAGGNVGVMLVPQANLISKVRSQGRSIQYHGQIEKAAGEALFLHLVDCIRAIALQEQYSTREESPPKWLTDFGKPMKVDTSVPPEDLFRDVSLYSTWDDNGIPLTNQNGEPLTKSALKKLKKQYDAHKKRHEKYLQTVSTFTPTSQDNNAQPDWGLLDASFIQVVGGSFGKLQALDMNSDMGPFCHVLNI